MKKLYFMPLLFVLSASVLGAELKLPRLFADHMIFQRNQPVKVWGRATPGQSVSITLAGQEVRTTTEASGRFQVFLEPMKAGGPYRMTITGDTTLVYDDVLVGDVWVAGGQSNMEWQLQWEVNNWKEEVKDSNYPLIRFFKVPNEFSPIPLEDLSGGEWKVASDSTSGEFSAVAWFFAKQNHLEKGVPVGVIESFWGGTPAEAWTSIETLTHTPGYEARAEAVVHPKIPWEEYKKQNDAREARKWELMRDEKGAVASGAQQIDYDDSDWKIYEFPCNCEMTDLTWLRKEVLLSPDTVTQAQLYIDRVVQEAFVFFNGELIWKKTWKDDEKPLDIPVHLIRPGKNVIAYRVANSWDNHVYFGNPDEMWLRVNGKKRSLEGKWTYSNDVEPKIPLAEKLFQKESFLYNAKILPLGGYTARGVIWYQGENNAGEPQYYHQLFSNMIEDWRTLWGEDLAFLFVQLANFMERKDEPQESDWAKLREAQAQTLSLPKTGMAIAIDIGNAEDIHPRNKQDVGKRLWLAAKKVSYGEKLVYSGPVYKSHKVKGDKVIVQFDHVGSGLKASGLLKGFAVAGEDHQFHWATAEINNDQVILTAEGVKKPVAIRYAWADNPEATLYNEENLPAVPFRTDDW